MFPAITKYVPVVCGVLLIVCAFEPGLRADSRWGWRVVFVALGVMCLYFAIRRIIHYSN